MNLFEIKVKMINSYGEKEEEDKQEFVNYYILRPISFWVASVFALYKISANAVTWLSLIIGLLGFLLFFKGDYYSQIIASFLIFVWLVLDCVDGNLARFYNSQSQFGDFLDSVVCYIIFSFLPISIAYSISDNNLRSEILYFLGWIYSIGFTLSRLIYQKFKQINSKKYKKVLSGELENSLKNKGFYIINNIFNPSGLMVPILVTCSIFELLEIYLIVYSAGYFFIFIYSLSTFINQARRD